MDYKIEYGYSKFGKTKFIEDIKLHFDKILVTICLNRKYHRLDVYVRRQENYKDKCKKFDIASCLISLMLFLEQNQLFCKKDGQTFKQDILKVENVKTLYICDLELCENDCAVLQQFPKLKWIETKKCTIYENCNLGSLKCSYRDESSLICNLDSFNGLEGEYFCLKKSRVKNRCKNVLHLNSIIATFDQVENMDYEHFFLTTVAPKMRKLEIYSNPRLKDKDLLFISGFYNLESVQIDGDVSSYEQVKRLEKLRELKYLFCTNKKELEATKEKIEDFAISFGNKPLEVQKNYLMMQKMVIQNQYQEFFHKIYVPRLERVSWQDKISSYNLEQIKRELQSIASMSRQERKQLAREPKKEFNLFDSFNELWFDEMPKQEEDDECYLVNSNPNPFGLEKKGIDYYVLKRKIYIEE